MKYRRRMSNPAPGRKEAKRWCIIASITILVLLTWIFMEFTSSKKRSEHDWHKPEEIVQNTDKSTTEKSDLESLKNELEVKDDEKVEIRSSEINPNSKIYGPATMLGMHVMWEIPEKINGVLFLAHGCSHRGTDFWEKDEFCPKCLGLPEDSSIKNTGVQMGFVVIAISSSKTCWRIKADPSEEMSELDTVKNILQQLISENKWESYPIYALGASSGGGFVLFLPSVMKLNGVCSQISAFPTNFDFEHLNFPYPPTVFVHMPRDENTAGKVEQAIKQLNQSNIQTLEIKHNPLPVNGTYLSDRIKGFDAEKSAKIYQIFKENKLLDEKNMLTTNPRSNPWRELIRSTVNDTLIDDQSGIIQALNVAYAQHEIMRDYTKQVLEWFQNQTTSS